MDIQSCVSMLLELLQAFLMSKYYVLGLQLAFWHIFFFKIKNLSLWFTTGFCHTWGRVNIVLKLLIAHSGMCSVMISHLVVLPFSLVVIFVRLYLWSLEALGVRSSVHPCTSQTSGVQLKFITLKGMNAWTELLKARLLLDGSFKLVLERVLMPMEIFHSHQI